MVDWLCEVAQAYPQYTLADLDDMPSVEFMLLHSRLSLGEYRRHLPMATLMAQLLNIMGGKGNGGKAIPSHKLYDAHEMLPPYAQPDALHRDLPFTPRQCSAIMDAIAERELPNWAAQVIGSIMPLAQVMRYGGTRGGGQDRDGFDQLAEQGG